MAYKVLIADDEEEILDLLELYLQRENLDVVKAQDGIQALNIILEDSIDIAVIDIMMPGIDGFKLVKKIREKLNIPVIILSAKNQDNDKILGLGLGADDYVTKPFNPLEVAARINAQLRRFHSLNSPEIEEQEIIKIGSVELNTHDSSLKVNDELIELTSIEYKILKLLMESPGRVFTKKQIFEAVWDDCYIGDDNTIMVHISNLRNKIEANSKKPIYIKTIRGLGYRFDKKVKVYE